tara:strand:- start:60 stop:617 length:558 start_codon:yes stop_codon:yes gene_type:complete
MILSPEIKKLFSEEVQSEFSKYFKLLNKSYLGKLYPKNGVIDNLDYLIKYSKLLKNNIEKTYIKDKDKDKLIVLLIICILLIRFNIINDLSSTWDNNIEATFNFGRKLFDNIFILKLKYNIINLDDEKLNKLYKQLFTHLYGDILPESTQLRGDKTYLNSELNFIEIHSKKFNNVEKLTKKSKRK